MLATPKEYAIIQLTDIQQTKLVGKLHRLLASADSIEYDSYGQIVQFNLIMFEESCFSPLLQTIFRRKSIPLYSVDQDRWYCLLSPTLVSSKHLQLLKERLLGRKFTSLTTDKWDMVTYRL